MKKVNNILENRRVMRGQVNESALFYDIINMSFIIRMA